MKKIISAVLVALLAIGNHADELKSAKSSDSQSRSMGPGPTLSPGTQGTLSPRAAGGSGGPSSSSGGAGIGRQGRGFSDFFAPLRGIFGRPRGPGSPQYASPPKQYGVKPSASESLAKPNTATAPYGDSFRPPFPSNFNEGGFSGGDSPPQYSNPGPYGKHHGAPPPPTKYSPSTSSHRNPSNYPPSHGHSHGGGHGPRGPPPPPMPPHNGPQATAYGGAQPQTEPQNQAPNVHYSYSNSEPKLQHHHYHAFQSPEGSASPGGPGSSYNEGSQGFEPSYDGPQPAQQFNRPSVSRPGGPSPPNNLGFDGPSGFNDFGGFGPGPSADFGGPQPQGSQSQRSPASSPGGFGFGGPPEDYPEQYEEQTRNTREPEIITADNYLQTQNQLQGPGPGPNQGGPYGAQRYTEDGYYPGSISPIGAPGGSNGGSSSSSHNYPNNFGHSTEGGPQGAPGAQGPPAAGHSGPILKSHPLRSPASHGHGAGHGHGRPSYHPYGQEESRKQPFLYRPVSSSIRVPGAVDEDAVYGKPMMMSATSSNNKNKNKKGKNGGSKSAATATATATAASSMIPMRYKSRRPPHSNAFKTSQAHPHPHPQPYEKPGEIFNLDSPKDPNYAMKSASFQSSAVVEPDSAASGFGDHGHGHHGHHHGLESSNGDRILYHVSGHQGPYSYRFGYDTGKGFKDSLRNRHSKFHAYGGDGGTGQHPFHTTTSSPTLNDPTLDVNDDEQRELADLLLDQQQQREKFNTYEKPYHPLKHLLDNSFSLLHRYFNSDNMEAFKESLAEYFTLVNFMVVDESKKIGGIISWLDQNQNQQGHDQQGDDASEDKETHSFEQDNNDNHLDHSFNNPKQINHNQDDNNNNSNGIINHKPPHAVNAWRGRGNRHRHIIQNQEQVLNQGNHDQFNQEPNSDEGNGNEDQNSRDAQIKKLHKLYTAHKFKKLAGFHKLFKLALV